MSNNLHVNVLNGLDYQMPQFQVSSAYTKGAMAKNVKNGSTYPVLPYVHSMHQRKVIFLYFVFVLFSCFDRRVRLSDERGYPSRLKVSRRFLGNLFYALPQMW